MSDSKQSNRYVYDISVIDPFNANAIVSGYRDLSPKSVRKILALYGISFKRFDKSILAAEWLSGCENYHIVISRKRSKMPEAKTACSHSYPQQCFKLIFPTTFAYCGFATGIPFWVRAAISASLAHPGCFLSLQENLRNDVIVYAQALSMSDAVRRLQQPCTGDRQFSCDAQDRQDTAPTTWHP